MDSVALNLYVCIYLEVKLCNLTATACEILFLCPVDSRNLDPKGTMWAPGTWGRSESLVCIASCKLDFYPLRICLPGLPFVIDSVLFFFFLWVHPGSGGRAGRYEHAQFGR